MHLNGPEMKKLLIHYADLVIMLGVSHLMLTIFRAVFNPSNCTCNSK
jgi:hypothetical protein